MLSALKNFGVTFLISAALFGIIAYFATGFVTSTVSSILDEEDSQLDDIIQNSPGSDETGNDSAGVPGNEDEAVEGESFNFLLITTDYRPDLYNDYQPSLELMSEHNWYITPPEDTMGSLSTDFREAEASSIVMVRIDRERRQYIYTYFTPDTRVYTSTGYHTLSDVYRLYGKEAVAEHIHAMTGLRIKYTALINGYNYDELISVLGTVSVNVAKDIYRDGTGTYTTQYETVREMTGADGSKWTERTPNTWIMGGGENELDGEELYTVLSVDERSAAGMEAKKNNVLAVLQGYLTSLASADEETVKYNLAKLINKESEWVNLKKPGSEDEETTVDTDTPSSDNTGADLPFDTTPVDPSETTASVPETDEWGNPVPVETDEFGNPIAVETDEFGNPIPEETTPPWVAELFEPENPIVETNFTMNDFDAVYSLLASIGEFEAVVLSYPGEYVPADGENAGYFGGNLSKALELFDPYRQTAE